jgi:tRNA-dihydrouridine synthase
MDYDKIASLMDVVRITKAIKAQLTEEEVSYLKKKRRLRTIAKCNKLKYNENINGYKYRRLLTWYNNRWGDNDEYMKIINNAETTPEQKYYEAKMFSASKNATEYMARDNITN